MWDANLRRRLCWMGGGLVLGLVFGGLWPDSPAHAVATSQIDGFAACTTPLDSEIEGIFVLDSITGDLKGTALNPITRQFTVSFGVNVASAFGLDATAKPRYLLVSGAASFRGGIRQSAAGELHPLRGRNDLRQGGGLRHSLEQPTPHGAHAVAAAANWRVLVPRQCGRDNP